MSARNGTAKRRYSDEDRAEALAALAANAGNVERTAAALGIPRTTLLHWAAGTRHPEASQMGQEKKGDMAAALEAVAWKLLDAIPGKIDDAPLNQTSVAMGIAIDKARLLRNQPTEITQHDFGDLTEEEIDRRIAELEARIAAAQGGEGKVGAAAPQNEQPA